MNEIIARTASFFTPATSLKIAKLAGKRHSQVLRDIRDIYAKTHGKCSRTTEVYEKFEEVLSFELDERGYISVALLSETLSGTLLTRYAGMTQLNPGVQEEAALKTIEQLLNIKLVRQYYVRPYRIDGYCIETKTAYEIDGPNHRWSRQEDWKRRKHLENKLGCTFVRIAV